MTLRSGLLASAAWSLGKLLTLADISIESLHSCTDAAFNQRVSSAFLLFPVLLSHISLVFSSARCLHSSKLKRLRLNQYDCYVCIRPLAHKAENENEHRQKLGAPRLKRAALVCSSRVTQRAKSPPSKRRLGHASPLISLRPCERRKPFHPPPLGLFFGPGLFA